MSYNLQSHWEENHTGVPIPAALMAQAFLKEHEKGMLRLHRGKKALTKAEMARFTAEAK